MAKMSSSFDLEMPHFVNDAMGSTRMRARRPSRRQFLATTGAAAVAWLAGQGAVAAEPELVPEDSSTAGKALVAITLDLEMSRNFPRWEDTHWDYEKGNLDEATKQYALAAACRAAEYGAKIHFFVVGRVLEQADVAWLQELASGGHRLGNHTYDHINVTATTAEQIQFRFQRAPWLIAGREPREVIAENVRLTATAMRDRLDLGPDGFRTPGGFHRGLREHADVRAMLRAQSYPWISSLYPAHAMPPPGQRPGEPAFAAIEVAQKNAQPFVYDDGLIEVPMSPPSDITCFRGGRWTLDEFLSGLRRGLSWCLERRAAFDFLGHPSCLCVVDPEMKAIDLVCRMTTEAGSTAKFADLNMLARRALMQK